MTKKATCRLLKLNLLSVFI